MRVFAHASFRPILWLVQRLFSTFPNSWPGLGLSILRLGTAFSMLEMAFVPQALAQLPLTLLLRGTSAADAALLIVGLWTPLAGVTAAAIHCDILISGQELTCATVCNAAVGLALALLGPGAWSLDARLFGRKRIL